MELSKYSFNFSNSSSAQLGIYHRAGVICVRDRMMGAILDSGDDLIEYSLIDVGKLTGHICAGTASAFLLTKKTLQALFGDAVPERGSVKIACNNGGGFLRVAAMITGADLSLDDANESDLSVDSTLSSDPFEEVLVFERKSDGRTVRGTWNKRHALTAIDSPALLRQSKVAVQSGGADETQKQQFRQLMNTLVEALIDGEVDPFSIEVQ